MSLKQLHNPSGLKTKSKKKNENLRKKKRQRERELEEKEKQEEKSKEKASTVESKKRTAAAEAKKKEKAPVASGSIINSAKTKGHTRGLISEHGETEFRRCQGGFLPPNSRITQGGLSLNIEKRGFIDVEEAFSLQIREPLKEAYEARKYPFIGKLASSKTFLFIAGRPLSTSHSAQE